MFPRIELTAQVLPITRGLLRFNITATPDFQYDVSVHSGALSFHIMIVDGDGERLLHHELLFLHPEYGNREHELMMVVPMLEPAPPQYFIWAISDSWLHAETILPVSFHKLVLPKKSFPPTELLDLQLLPVNQIGHEGLASLFGDSFTHLNAVQTQTFKTLMSTDENCLLCAPTGAGKVFAQQLQWGAYSRIAG